MAWRRRKNLGLKLFKIMDIDYFFKEYIYDFSLIIVIIIYSTIFSYYNILKLYSFRIYAWDFGTITQSISNALRGELFTNNVEVYYSRCYFGVHFSPIYFLVLPFFALYPKEITILIFQSVTLAISAFPLYLLARHELKEKLSAFLVCLSYLLNPSIQGMSWYHFPPQTFLPLFILFATYFLKKNKKILSYIFLVLSLMTAEHVVYFLFLYIFYIYNNVRTEIHKFLHERKINSAFVFFVSIIITYIFWYILSRSIIDKINPNPPIELKAVGNWKFLEINDMSEIPLKLLVAPDKVIEAIRFNLIKKLLYILITFTPSAFICFLSPTPLLPCFWWFILALTSNHDPYYELGFHYPAFTIPFIMVATIEGIKNIASFLRKEEACIIIRKISLSIIIMSLAIFPFTSPISFIHKVGDFTYFRDYGITFPSFVDCCIREVLEKIPEDSYILTTPTIFPAIATYRNAYTLPAIDVPSQRLFRSHLIYLKTIDYDYIFFSYIFDKSISDLVYNSFIKDNAKYGLFLRGPGIELYKKGYTGFPYNIPLKFSYKELYLKDSRIVYDYSSESGKVIFIESTSVSGRVSWYGPYITLTPGNYVARFKIKVDNIKDEKLIRLDVWSNDLKLRLASYDVYGRDFEKPLTWKIFSIPFGVSSRLGNIEFRGTEVGSDVSVTLDYIEVFIIESP